MYVVGAFATYFLMMRLARGIHGESEKLDHYNTLYIICYVCGWFGARAFSIVVDENIYEPTRFFESLFQFGAMTFYGGLLAAIFAGGLYAIRKRLSWQNLLDVGVVSGLLALAIGRIGCFLNGDDYGQVITDGWLQGFGVSFPNLGDDRNQIERHAVQLYETVTVFLGVWYFKKYFHSLRKNLFPGAPGLMLLMSYSVARFFLEYFRADPRGSVGSYLSTSQFISVLLVVCSGTLFYRMFKTKSTS